MKRFFTFLSIFTLLNSLNAQAPAKNTAASSRPLWVGLDFGGTWQTSDMKPQAGIGWGITLSRYSKLDKKDHFIMDGVSVFLMVEVMVIIIIDFMGWMQIPF